MGAMEPQITGVSIACSAVCSGANQRRIISTRHLFCEGNPPVTGGFPSQRTSNAENVSIWWRLHEKTCWDCWTKRHNNWVVHCTYQCYVCHVDWLHSENAAVMMTVWQKKNDFRIAGLCEGNPPVTDGFPSQRANNVGFGVSVGKLKKNSRLLGDCRRIDAHETSV